ncbi:hypothetical protein CSR02_13570 [Acetobacter pomorum]|uniref:Uncharacterized protein n=2 Tax=Acetobacter pomorum TaxID=65959 RepID=A0A2G4RBC4_9PROT|nr:hypothetical protein CSR02_13570 [Acetobacter pomorum]
MVEFLLAGAMAKTGPRKDWSSEDNVALIVLWHKFSSVALIALALDRSRSSVQTQASRKKLPQIKGDMSRHRQKWTSDEDDCLVKNIERLKRKDGLVPALELSKEMGRSIDAIMARLESMHRNDLIKILWVPSLKDLLGNEADNVEAFLNEHGNSYVEEKKIETKMVTAAGEVIRRKWPKNLDCLRCKQKFLSYGPGNRICPKCQKINSEMAD